MTVKITKKSEVAKPRTPAPLVEGAEPLAPTPTKTDPPVGKSFAQMTHAERRAAYSPQWAETREEMLARWAKHPAPDAKPRKCQFCGQFYIIPCDAEEAQRCANKDWFDKRHAKTVAPQQEAASGVENATSA